MVLEICSGGDLYTREPYTEAAAQTIVKSLFSAVAYLHSHGIVHRDVGVCELCCKHASRDDFQLYCLAACCPSLLTFFFFGRLTRCVLRRP